MQKWIKLWRYSIALLFFIVLIGFCIVHDNKVSGQLFGDDKNIMLYLGLVLLLTAWLFIEISFAKSKTTKYLIPSSIVLVVISAIFINGYLSLIAGIILAIVISLHYVIVMKSKQINNNLAYKNSENQQEIVGATNG